MKKLLYSGQMKALDAYTIEQIGIPSPVLMERAALEVVLRIKARGCCGRILVLCGTGNNGGDGIAVARILFQQEFDSAYYVAGNEAHYTDQTRLQLSIADALGVTLRPYYVSSETLAALGPEYDFTGSLIGDKACSVVFDNSKVKKLVPDFKAVVTAREGIRRTVEYVTSHPECQHDDEEFDKWCDDVIAAVEKMKESFAKE